MSESERPTPPDLGEFETPQDALKGLSGHNGATIVPELYATQIAEQFGVTLDERPGHLEPISDMDRLQPDNDQLGIGIGSLCKALCEQIDGIDAEDFVAGGKGTTQRGLKRENLPLLEAHVDGATPKGE